MSLDAQIASLRAEISAATTAATDEAAIEAVRVGALGKKGSVSALLATLGALPADERKAAGAAIVGAEEKRAPKKQWTCSEEICTSCAI